MVLSLCGFPRWPKSETSEEGSAVKKIAASEWRTGYEKLWYGVREVEGAVYARGPRRGEYEEYSRDGASCDATSPVSSGVGWSKGDDESRATGRLGDTWESWDGRPAEGRPGSKWAPTVFFGAVFGFQKRLSRAMRSTGHTAHWTRWSLEARGCFGLSGLPPALGKPVRLWLGNNAWAGGGNEGMNGWVAEVRSVTTSNGAFQLGRQLSVNKEKTETAIHDGQDLKYVLVPFTQGASTEEARNFP
ncbi:hypothetical protein B0T17DRAFT_504660 [Bombardia bombarda]|uniref:Uncharacterized protein n=1 Tax=Bombardia bombarda TaxID=252184 RepID=A0AA39XNJ1_9PEZI|nr:hypothetical protein B0T17DRAFT_504660 [Bombardia bombarda]